MRCSAARVTPTRLAVLVEHEVQPALAQRPAKKK